MIKNTSALRDNIISSKNSRLSTNVNKLLDVFNTQGITFEESDEVYNVLTKKVLATDVTETFLSMREAGNAKYCEFVSENLLGSKSIWDTIKKEKLPTFTKNCFTQGVMVELFFET